MRRTSLHNVKLNRTDFTADILFNELFKGLSYAREILVTEIIHNSRLIFLALKLYALGNCDDNGFVLCHLISYVLQELFGGKVIFREIDKVRGYLVICSEYAGGSCEPASVSAHYLNDSDGLDRINRAVTNYLLNRCGNILCGRAEAWCMVCYRQVVIYSLWYAYNSYL